MAELGSEIFFAGIAELNRMVRAKEATALDLARAFGRRLETLGPRYNALALSLTERAIRQAKAVDAEIKHGRLRGPLQGVPYGAKDLLSVAGQITTWGARPYAAQVFDYDATVIQKLESAGAPLVGKLAMVELAGRAGTLGTAPAGPAARRADRRLPWPPVWRRSPSVRRHPVPS